MKLTRITKIQHRVFRDFAWASHLHPFAQFNVIYGWNGCGKTTLSSLLSLVEKKKALTEGEFELEFDGKSRVAGTKFDSEVLPQVRVFNREFVNATLALMQGIAPIYFLGEDSIEKQREVAKLKGDLALASYELVSATNARKSTDEKLDEFCREKARFVKELLTNGNSTAYNNYDKRRFKQAVQAVTAQTVADALLSEASLIAVRSQKDAQPKPIIEKAVVESIDLAALAQEVDVLVNRSVVARTLDELTADASLAAWVHRGLMLHSGVHSTDHCRFCSQPFEERRRSELDAHFNDAFANFQNEGSTLLEKLRAAKQSIRAVPLPDPSRFYEVLSAEVIAARAATSDALSTAEIALDTMISRAEIKRANPFAPRAASERTPAMLSALRPAVLTLNAIIDKHNRISSEFKASVDTACKQLEAAYVAETHGEYVTLSDAVRRSETHLDGVRGKPADIQSRIEVLERAIVQHQRPADELTEELRAYLGRDELRFELKGAGYALMRSGQPVSHLSEGERTAIAFLYFLKSLQDKSFDMAKGIVVIDDPVSSLDANALYSAFGYMKERTKECGQLFIFTHSFPFFRLVKNWFHHLPGQRKRNVEVHPARFFLLNSRRHSDGSRTSRLGPLDPLLEKHESEYQYLFKRVYDEAHRLDVATLEHHYGLPNIARRLLEAFLAFRFPEMAGDLQPRLDRVVFDTVKKTRILRLLNTYSHAEAVIEPEHDLSLLAETQPVLLDVLEMMKAIDKDHYEGLEKLVAPSLMHASPADDGDAA